MPTPSKAELFTQLGLLCKWPHQVWKFGANNTHNFLTMADNIRQALEGDHSSAVASELDKAQTSLSGLYGAAKNMISPVLINIAEIGYSINTSGMSIETVIEEILKAMKTASETIASRNITFASISAGGGNAADGTIYRTVKDKHDNQIESGQMGTIKFEVIADKNTGTDAGREQLRVYGYGTPTKIDEIDLGTAPAEEAKMTFFKSGSSQLLQNSSFDSINLTTNSAEQSGWTLSSVSSSDFEKITQDSSPANIFRFQEGQETTTSPKGAALKIKTNDQWFAQYVGRNRIKFKRDVPYFLILRWMRKSSADGTITLRLGASTATATVSSASNDAWNTLTIGPGTDDGWYDVFKEDWDNTVPSPDLGLGVRVRVDWNSRTTGEVVFDEMILAEAVKFNGVFYLPVAGSSTGDALVGDTWTFADAYTTGGATEGVNQEVIARLYKRHLNHTTGAETYADAS